MSLQNLGWMLGGLALDYGIDQIEAWVRDYPGTQIPNGPSSPPVAHPGASDFDDPIEEYNFRELQEATRFCGCEED